MQKLTLNAQNEVLDATEKGKNDLKILAQNNQLSDSFISENMPNLDWEIITIHQKISMKTAVQFTSYIKWHKIKDNSNVTPDLLLLAKYYGNIKLLLCKELNFEPFVRTHKDVLPWNNIDLKPFSNDFIEEMTDYVVWKKVFAIDRKEEAFIHRNMHKLTDSYTTWHELSFLQTVSEQFLRDFKENIQFHYLVGQKYHTLSDAFVEDFKYALHKDAIIKNQKNNLSAAYLKEYRKFDAENFYRNTTEEWLRSQPNYALNWFFVSELSKFSDDFVLENLERMHIYRLATNHKFSEELVRVIAPKINDKEKLSYIFAFQDFSQDFLEEFIPKINLQKVSSNSLIINKLSEDFIKKYKKKWDIAQLTSVRSFSDEFLKELTGKRK